MPAAPRQPDLPALERELEGAMIRDARRLRSRLGALRKRLDRGERIDRSIVKIQEDLERSRVQRAAREASRPRLVYPDSLPVAQRKDEIARAISDHQVVIVCGETGSGKTTQLPKICLELGRGAGGMIGHTQPRRIAARAVAARISEELGATLGGPVGYKVRFSGKVGDSTLVKLMTDGILLAETRSDRLLERYDTIIIDEAHERSLNIDFLLGYLKQLLPKRPELKVIITSATIDPDRFAEHFSDSDGMPAPIIQVSGRTYPVDVRYRPIETEDDPDEDSPEMQHAILGAVDEVTRHAGGRGDILIFLSGEREIRATAESLKKHHPRGTEILPLYARLTFDEQRKIFEPHSGRRIVLATNVAETSLTVPGITAVIDPGYARISRFSTRKKVQGLPIEPISRASADQRAGRCGRVAPGVCIRLYSVEDFEKRGEFTSPEIMRTNLAAAILQMKAIGLGAIDRFPFVERPSDRAIAAGYETLYEIGALDGLDPDAKLTPVGHQLTKLPIDPRIGRMVLAAAAEGVLGEVLIIASALSCQDPRVRPFDRRNEADAAHALFVVEGGELSDFMSYLALWDAYHEQKKRLSYRKLRAWCTANFVSPVRMREWIDVHRLVRELAGELDLGSTNRAPVPKRDGAPPVSEGFRHPLYPAIHRALLAGLISNIGVLGERHEYAGPRALRFNLFPGSILFDQTPKWVMCAELVRTTKLYARSVAKVQPRWIERAAQHLVKITWSDPHWDERTAQVWGYERVTLFGLELVPRRHRHYGPHAQQATRLIFIQRGLVDGLFWTTARFRKQNKALLERVEEIQARTRRHDLLASVEAQFDFYDARVPQGIYTGRAFDEWIRREQKRDPDVLCMTEQDLMPEGAEALDPEMYPDTIDLVGAPIPVEYHFEPGTDQDGVTLEVPVEMLPQVSRERLEWLVPGLLPEKVMALVRTLPKEVRRQLGPTPELAARCIEGLAGAKGSLVEALAAELSRLSGLSISPLDFSPAQLPDHLRMNLRVSKGPERAREVLAHGRDADHLKQELREEIVRAQSEAPDPRWSRRGLRTWGDLEDLPVQIERDVGGIATTAFPALAPSRDDDASAEVRLCSSREQALRLHRLGLRRLLVAETGTQIRFLIENLPAWEELVLLYSTQGSPAVLEAGIEALVVERAFLSEREEVRTRAQFEARLDSGWHRLGESADEVVIVVEAILRERQALALRLDGDHPAWRESAVRSIEHQVEHLLPEGVLLELPLATLREVPRYLRAASIRLEKLASRGASRDAELQLIINGFWDRYAEHAGALTAEDRRWLALEEFRWAVEELRVSLFAQQLGTSRPVSETRLEAMWSKIARQSA